MPLLPDSAIKDDSYINENNYRSKIDNILNFIEMKEYIVHIPVKDQLFTVRKSALVKKNSPYFRERIDIAVGKAIEKLLENNKLDATDINSINYGGSECEYADGQVLEVKFFNAEIKTKKDVSYLLEEFTYSYF